MIDIINNNSSFAYVLVFTVKPINFTLVSVKIVSLRCINIVLKKKMDPGCSRLIPVRERHVSLVYFQNAFVKYERVIFFYNF